MRTGVQLQSVDNPKSLSEREREIILLRYTMRRKKKVSTGTIKYVLMLFVLLAAMILASLFAEQSWFLELFSHFHVQYAIIALVFAALFILYKKPNLSLIALIIALTQTYYLYPLYMGGHDFSSYKKSDQIKVLQYNVNRNNTEVGDMARWIISNSENIDIVVLYEVTELWQDALQRIKWTYPYHISRDIRGNRKTVVLSKLLIDEMEVKTIGNEAFPTVVIRGATNGYEVPFVLYSIHPHPPILPSYAKWRNNVLVSAAEAIAKEKVSHKILIGDFNCTSFSPWFKKMSETSGLYNSNDGIGVVGTWPSFLPPVFRIGIDNMLLSDNIKVDKKELGPRIGSDHLPVITTLDLYEDETKNY